MAAGPSSQPPAPPWLVRSAAVAGRLLVLALLVWLLAAFAVGLTSLVVSVLVALLVAGVLAPLVGWATGRGVPRWLAAGGAVCLLLAVLVGAGAVLGVTIAEQLPELRDRFQQVASDVSQRFGIEIPGSGSSQGGSSGGASSPGSCATGCP